MNLDMEEQTPSSALSKIMFVCLILFVCGGLLGCLRSPIGLVIDSVAASNLRGKRANILVTEDETGIEKCQFIKHVYAYNGWAGRYEEKAIEKATADATHYSAQAGANTLLILSKTSAFSGTRVKGDAYLCPDKKDNSISVHEEPVEQ